MTALQKTKVMVNFRIPSEIKDLLELEAEKDGRSLTGLVVKILTDWLEAKRKEPPIK